MRNFLLKKYVQARTANTVASSSFKCEDCGEYVRSVHRLSILNLILYVIGGGILTYTWHYLAGIVFVVGCLWINKILLKPVCSKCFSPNIHERKTKKEEEQSSSVVPPVV